MTSRPFHSLPSARDLLGTAQPLSVWGARPQLEKRAVSKRWLAGTVLTGATSCLLMGAALLMAMEGVAESSTPAELAALAGDRQGRMVAGERKSARIYDAVIASGTPDRRLISVPTLVQNGDRSVARTVSLVQLRMPLGIAYPADASYPAFDPLKMVAEIGNDGEAVDPTQFYGANIETDVALRTLPFTGAETTYDTRAELSDAEAERIVREQNIYLTEGEVQLAALPMVDPNRFGSGGTEGSLIEAVNVRITAENVSTATPSPEAVAQSNEMMIDIDSPQRLKKALADSGLKGRSAASIAEAMATLLGGDQLKDGQKLRITAYMDGDEPDVRRLSIYDGVTHRATVALDDNDQFVPAAEPEEIAMTRDTDAPVRVRAGSGSLPSIYDAIYRASFAYGLTDDMAKRLVQILASDVDMRTKAAPQDQIEILFSEPDGEMAATDASAILMAHVRHAGDDRRLYRFESEDGTVDFYDEEGSSGRQVLLRNPVPNGLFKSGFGMRRHPILGYKRMHTGADWAAPRGTPIIASGNGIVEKAGWSGGYGRQTLIRHPNGYVSSYSHQNTIAKGVVPGAKVRQGQVIGTVGSTGLSTGPHLHYELIVNGNKVDPMRVRLPGGKKLKGNDLERFEAIRDEIDRLVESNNRTVAALQ